MKRHSETRARRPREERAHPGPWLLLFGVAFVLRAGAAWLAGPPAEPGMIDTVAWNLARGAGFSVAGPDGPLPTASIPPLTPWLASLVYRGAGHAPAIALMFQCAAGALVTVLIAWFGAATFGGTIGRLAGWISAADPLLIGAATTLRAEALLGVTMMAALGATAAWVKTPRPGRALGVGIAWGIAVLAHDAVLLLPLLALAWAWVPLGLTVTAGDRYRQAFLVVLGVAVTLGPWVARNVIVMRAPVAITTAAGRALLEGNHAEAEDAPDLEGEHRLPIDGVTARGGPPEARADARAAAMAWAFMRTRIGRWPVVALRKAGRLWSLASERRGASVAGGAAVEARIGSFDALPLGWLLIVPLAVWGIARTLASPRRWYQSLGLVVIVYFTGLAMVFDGGLWMRVPIEPLLALFAAAGFEEARRRIRSRRLGLRVVEGRR